MQKLLNIKFLKSKSKIWICCFILCACQSIDLINNFIQFDVRTEIIYNFSQPLEVPDVDFFFPMVTVLNFSAFYHRRPTELVHWCKILFNKSNVTINSVQEFDQHCSNLSLLIGQSSTWLPALLTVGDVEELTQDPRELIDEIYTFNSIRKNLFDTKICTKKRFLNGYGLLVRISCRNGSLPFTRENTSGLGGNNFILSIKNRIKRPFGFRLSSSKRIVNQGSQYISIDPPIDKYYTVTSYFTRQVTTSLPWPYKTKCLHYDKDKTMTDCLNSHLLNQSNQAITIDSVAPFKFYPKKARFTNGLLDSTGAFMSFLNQCSKLIDKSECYEVNYYTSAKIYIDQEYSKSSCMFQVDIPINPDVYFIAQEKLTLTELLVSLYSVLGVYFGVTVYDKLKLRLQDVNKCFTKSDNEQKLGPKKRAFIIVGPNREVPLYY
uniref:Uncharacterized protein n=1 Tax=Tetranychus urticae TaxID=32264 RepID=T1KDM1_TETUR